MIHVIATIEAHPSQRDALLEEFRKIVPLVRAENGCLEYGPTVDVASGLTAQGSPRDNVVTIVEQWTDLDALKAHAAAPHMTAYRERVKGMVVTTKLQVLQPV